MSSPKKIETLRLLVFMQPSYASQQNVLSIACETRGISCSTFLLDVTGIHENALIVSSPTAGQEFAPDAAT